MKIHNNSRNSAMPANNKRLIVILGMHRSGTSLITRGLKVFGVELGADLLAPVQGENPKGYFEDIDILTLNEEMLKAINSEWYYLTQIEPADILKLRKEGFFIRAVDLLRRKTLNASIFGFKDPRTAKLLPFWHQVFEHCGFDTSYIIVIRNPLSVAKSIERRNGLQPEKTYMLWLEHTLTSLGYTKEFKRIIVDYDRFLLEPKQDLGLIAGELALQIDKLNLDQYLSEFLDKELRHSIYNVDDLTLDQACPPLVKDVYKELLGKFCTNNINNTIFYSHILSWEEELERLKPILSLVDKLSFELTNLNHLIADDKSKITTLIKYALGQDENIFRISFDAEWYLQHYPEVANFGAEPYRHYIEQGLEEGKYPSANIYNFIQNTLIRNSIKLFDAEHTNITQLVKISELESIHSNKLQEIQQKDEQYRINQHQEFTERESKYISELSAMKQQLETLQIDAINRERFHSNQLQEILQRNEQYKINQHQEFTERESKYISELSAMKQQLETLKVDALYRERFHSNQLQEIQQSNEQNIVNQELDIQKRELSINLKLTTKNDELFSLLNHIRQIKQSHLQELDDLSHELDSICSKFVWFRKKQLHSLSTKLSGKNYLEVNKLLSSTNIDEIVCSQSKKIIPYNNISVHSQSSSNITNEIHEMSVNQITSEATTIEELLAYHDERFVYCAFKTLLGRTPDPTGMNYYLKRVRAGVSKMEIVYQICSSPEGKSRYNNLAGLNNLLLRQKWLKKPIIGNALRFIGIYNNEENTQQKLRAIENKLSIIDNRLTYQFNEIKQMLSEPNSNLGDITYAAQNEKAENLSNPLVSFVIPIHNRTDVLREAIQSALEQTHKNIEVILVTDGSPHETLDVVNEFVNDLRVKIFNFPTSSGNAVRGRNKGILESNGKYIAFLDSDDVAVRNRIELSLPLLETGEADIVYGAWRAVLDGTRNIEGLTNGQVIYSPDCDLEMLKEICVPCQSTVIVRKDLLLRTGFLKSTMQYREDHELWIRLAYYGGKFKSIQDVLVNLRLHAGNNELNFKHNDEHWQSVLFEEYGKPARIPKKIVFIVAGLGISGGLIVILKHANFLMSIGHDVSIINTGAAGKLDWAGENSVPVLNIDDKRNYLLDNIDILFSTFWATCEWLERIQAKRKLYLIQSDERLFYDELPVKSLVADTYSLPYEFVAISGWICEMLNREFSKKSYLVPNGIDTTIFQPCTPLTEKNKKRLRVLIEGPIDIPFKGVADAYDAIAELDCEIWIVSSAGKPKSNWRVDRFFEGVPFIDMPKIYSSCDILLKMSRVESFSYPPLEAMACGCAVVVSKVLGSIEYVIDDYNALIVEHSDVENASKAVEKLIKNPTLRKRLIEGGYETAKNWTWDNSFEAMLEVINLSHPKAIQKNTKTID